MSQFVGTSQELFTATIGIHGILEAIGFSHQYAAALRGYESVADELSFQLLDVVPVCMQNVQQDKEKLDKTLQKAIDTYTNGLP